MEIRNAGRVAWTVALALVVGMGCSRTTEPDDGNGGGSPPSYTVEGNFHLEGMVYLGIYPNGYRFDGGMVMLEDSAGNGISGATVVINGDTLNGWYGGTYADTVNVRYVAGATYDIEVLIDSSSYFRGSITAPDVDSIIITSPSAGDTVPYDSLRLTWEVYGDPSSPIYVVFGDYEFPVPSGQTTFTVPDSIVLNYVRDHGSNRTVGVASYNALEIPELLDSSYIISGTVNLIQVVIDTTG